MDTLLLPILLIMGGVLIGVLLKVLSNVIRIPYTVALFAVGIGIGLLYKNDFFTLGGFMKPGISMITEMNPDFILYVFLPILIFDAAYGMDLHVFKKTLVNSSLLAGPGLVICMLLTAAFVMFLTRLGGNYDTDNWKYALMFGGLISATDPVAVVALLKELGTSKRFSTLVDGESLLNDGTGIVCFMLFYSQFTGAGPVGNPVVFFLWVCLASFVLGYLISKIALGFIVKFQPEPSVQNCIMLVGAYLTFLLAQSTLNVSGVIALVVFGHFFAQRGKPLLKPEADQFISKFWGFMSDIANTLIFLIVGVIIAVKVEVSWYSLLEVTLVFIGLNVIRFLMVWLLFPLLKKSGYGISFKESVMLGWGGLRGALGMSMALMVSYNENIPLNVRDCILLWTAGVVTLTLCINATTSKWLVEKLGLIKKDGMIDEEVKYRQNEWLRSKDFETLEALKNDTDLAGTDWQRVENKIISEYKPKLKYDIDEVSTEEIVKSLRASLLITERYYAEAMLNNGLIGYASYRKIVDFVDEYSDFDGKYILSDRDFKQLFKTSRFARFEKKGIKGMLELSSAFLIIQYNCKQYLKMVIDKNQAKFKVRESAFAELYGEIDQTIELVKTTIRDKKGKYADIYEEMITERATRLMLVKERETLEQMKENGLIDSDYSEVILNDIEARQHT